MKTPGTASHYAHQQSEDIPSITSEEILDENSQSGKNRFTGAPRRMNRKYVAIAVVAVLAVVAVVVAVVVTKSSSSSKASTSSGDSSSSSTSDSGKTSTSGGSTSSKKSSNSTSSSSASAKVTTDPTSDTYSVTAFAIGDWGQTTDANDSCCTRRHGYYNGYDWNAEAGVAKLMDLEAETDKPSVVISHGDNFYWTGIQGTTDQAYRFEQTFESRHKVESMGDVPWINVLGNHDYGGGSYICTDSSEQLAACTSSTELVAAMEKRFTLQSTYKSPNNDRWVLTDHYYKYSLSQGDVTIDIFNLDMNNADSHGANEICCQCYSYASGDDSVCTTSTRGDKSCCGGDTDLYDACVGQFNTWGEEAMTKLSSGVKASTATWKIVNSHYSPYDHFGETAGTKWLTELDGLGVQLWTAGHTHGEKHDYASFGMHFIQNGAGGGIQSESAAGIPPYATSKISNLWTGSGYPNDGDEYGFFKIQASSAWLKVQFMTFDDSWSFTTTGSSLGASKIGGVKSGWCYYIPVDGSTGQKC